MATEWGVRYKPNDVFGIMENSQRSSREKQKIKELRKVAQLVSNPRVLGEILPRRDNIEIEIPDHRDQAPDIRLVGDDGFGRKRTLALVEVVSFVSHSEKEGMLKLLGRTKLAPEMAYPQKTLILFSIETKVKNLSRACRNLSRVFDGKPLKHSIIVSHDNYLARVYPGFEEY